MKLFFQPILVFFFGACLFSLAAEETPTATVPTSTAVPTIPASPSSSPQLPKFPIVSEKFKTIDDSMELPDRGLPEAASYDKDVLLEILPALQASTQEHLKASVDRSATYVKIFNHADDFRGHVVQFETTVKFLFEKPEQVKDAGGTVLTLARGHLSSSYQLISFLSLEPLPPGLKKGDSVLLTGVFMQRFAYINQKTPGVELTWTPLIIVKRLEPFTVVEAPPTSSAWLLADILFGMVAVGLFMGYFYREGNRTVRNNIFRKIKVQRTGQDRLFPGPDSRKK